jgi:hypothetical protein
VQDDSLNGFCRTRKQHHRAFNAKISDVDARGISAVIKFQRINKILLLCLQAQAATQVIITALSFQTSHSHCGKNFV